MIELKPKTKAVSVGLGKSGLAAVNFWFNQTA